MLALLDRLIDILGEPRRMFVGHLAVALGAKNWSPASRCLR